MQHTIRPRIILDAIEALNAALPVLEKHAPGQWFKAMTVACQLRANLDSMAPIAVVEPALPVEAPMLDVLMREAA